MISARRPVLLHDDDISDLHIYNLVKLHSSAHVPSYGLSSSQSATLPRGEGFGWLRPEARDVRRR